MESRSLFPRTVAARAQDGIYRRRWLILGVLITSLMAIVLDNTVLNVALKTIAEPGVGLGASQSQLEWGINSYTLVFAGLLFTFGVVGDRIGRKRMLMIGLVVFGLFSLVTAYAQTPDQLIWARAAMGLGAAAVMPQTLSIISNVFDPAERPRAIGIWAMAVGIGVAIGPVVGGLLLAHFWWGSVFLLNVPFTAAGAAAVWLVVPESKNPDPGRIDYVGVLASIAGLVLLVYGIIQGGEKGSWVHADVLGPIVAGLAVLAFFTWYERRLRYPSLDVRLFRNPRLSSAVGALALVFFGMMGALFFLSFYLQSVRGYSPLQAGLLSLPFAAGQLLMAPRSAALVRRFGTQGGRRVRPAGGHGGAGRLPAARRRHPDLGARGPVLHPGRRDGHRHATGHGGGDVGGAQGAGGLRLGAHQRRPAGSGCARGGRPRLHPRPGLPGPAQPASDRAAGRRQGRRGGVDRGHAGRRGQAGAGQSRRAGPGNVRRSRLRARHAHHHPHLGRDHPARRAGHGDLDARARYRPAPPADAAPSASAAEVGGQTEPVPAAAGISASRATPAQTLIPVTPAGTVLPVAGVSSAGGSCAGRWGAAGRAARAQPRPGGRLSR